MSVILSALGLVLIAEGLALALAPSRIEEALRLLMALGAARRRQLGLAALALGIVLVWMARILAA